MLVVQQVWPVLETERVAFAAARREARSVAREVGCVGRVAGWAARDQAVALTFWASEQHANEEDAPTSRGWRCVQDLAGVYDDVACAVRSAGAARLVESRVSGADREAFVRAQRAQRNQGLCDLPGFLVGAFCGAADDPTRFLEVTLWQMDAHRAAADPHDRQLAAAVAEVVPHTRDVQTVQLVRRWAAEGQNADRSLARRVPPSGKSP